MLANKHKGAALLAVLVVAVVMVVLLGVASTTLQSRLLLAQDSKQKLQDQAAVYSKINELVYLASTARITVAGISQGTASRANANGEIDNFDIRPIGDELRVDGFLYKQENGLDYSIQSQAGLIPVNSSGQYWVKRWLQGYGYSVIEQARYADILADYADPDNWRRPGGAEMASYTKQPFPAPANFLLQSCSELWKVLQWPDLLKQHSEMIGQCSLGRGDSLNLNAVPLSLWQILWPNSALRVSEHRQQGHWLLTNADMLTLEPSLLLTSEDYVIPIGGKDYLLYAKKHSISVGLMVEVGAGKQPSFTLRSIPVSNY